MGFTFGSLVLSYAVIVKFMQRLATGSSTKRIIVQIISLLLFGLVAGSMLSLEYLFSKSLNQTTDDIHKLIFSLALGATLAGVVVVIGIVSKDYGDSLLNKPKGERNTQ